LGRVLVVGVQVRQLPVAVVSALLPTLVFSVWHGRTR